MSPLEVRAWVTERSAEDIYTELLQRIETLDNGIAPYREIVLKTSRALFESVLKRLGWPGGLPELPEDAQRLVVRGGAATIVANYWAEQEYRPGVVLPSVMSRGVPWDTLPDAIHLLDLDPDRIRVALQRIPPLDTLDSAGLGQLSEPPNDLLMLLGAAQGTIRALGPRAAFDPVVHIALFSWLRLAHYAPTKEDAEVAADGAARLLDEFLPDLSRRMIRTPERLEEVDAVFRDLLKKVKDVKQALRAKRVTTSVLARARTDIGTGITRHDLARWQRMDGRAVALERLALARRRSVKAVTEQLRLAEKAGAIDEAWGEFLTYLRTLPDAQQQAIVSALQPALGSPTTPPASPTET